MNYLAHAFLAQNESEFFRLGNLMADHIKGPPEKVLEFLPASFESVASEVLAGLTYHRRIDHTVDHFPATFELRRQFTPEYRRYAGIVLDMAWDHLLARSWNSFSPETNLPRFAREQYRLLRDHRQLQPISMQEMVHYMVKNDWLVSYANAEHIRRSLTGMSRRMRRENKLAESYREIPRLEPLLNRYFPLLMAELMEQPLRT